MYLFVAYTAHHIVGLHIPYGGGTFAWVGAIISSFLSGPPENDRERLLEIYGRRISPLI